MANEDQTTDDCAFSLVEESWLPVRFADGRVASVGLRDVFRRSADIVALAETTPPSLIAQYRLLLAITHRALSTSRGRWRDRDRAAWFRDGLPVESITAYLDEWSDRFWLFHPDYPFMQVAALAYAEATHDRTKPWTQISLASATGNAPVVFDHAYDAAESEVTPAHAINTLLGFLQFTPGGLVKVFRGSDKAGALADTAAVVPVGQSLAETLILSLHAAPSRTRERDDKPCWERDALTEADLTGQPVPATGANDRYTRQSRAVLFLRNGAGNVDRLRFGAGQALADSEAQPDPMASFRPGSKNAVRVSFEDGKAVWRDLPSLVPGPATDSEHQRPAGVINYAVGLHQALSSSAVTYQPLLVAGLASDQAKLVRWRREQIVLPAALMTHAERAQRLKKHLADAEELFRSLRWLATLTTAQTLPEADSNDTKKKAQGLVAAGPLAAIYFAALERSLPDLMEALGRGDFDAADQHWQQALSRAARRAWHHMMDGLGAGARVLKANAMFGPRMHGLVAKYAPRNDAQRQGEGVPK